MKIELERKQICDLMLACTAAKFNANDEGKKWDELRELLKKQLEKIDN